MEENNYKKFIPGFKNYLSAIKNLSNIYVDELVITIKQFLDFINQYKYKNAYENIEDITLNELRTITNTDIYSFVFYLVDNHYKPTSRAVKIEHIRSFFDYLFRIKQKIFRQPFNVIKPEKRKSKELPNYLSVEESKRLSSLYSNSDKPNDIRDNAILNLFLNSGLRVSEVAKLKISDFNFSTNTFIIHGKGNKERVGYMNKLTKEAVLKYLELRKTIQTTKDTDILFLSQKKQPVSVRAIQYMVKSSYDKIQADSEQYSAHTLRHTCATLLLKSGTNIKTIQELLGHTTIDTTKIYTHLYDKEVKDAMKIHPLAKFKMADALAYNCASIA